MSEKVIEAHVYDFLKDAVDAANDPDTGDEDSPFFGAELHQHVFQKFDDAKWFGIRVGNGESTLAPNSGATEIEEFDGSLTLVTFTRLKTSDFSDLEDARTKAFDLAKAVAFLFVTEDPVHGPTMGGRVNDARVTRCPRGFDEFDSSLYAVCNMPLIVNDSGSR